MSLRPPSTSAISSYAEASFDALGHEILSEKAASLGRAGRKAETSLSALRDRGDEPASRPRLLKEAADAVHAYFIQRELCGFRRHDAVIKDLAIPRAVLVRLGAK